MASAEVRLWIEKTGVATMNGFLQKVGVGVTIAVTAAVLLWIIGSSMNRVINAVEQVPALRSDFRLVSWRLERLERHHQVASSDDAGVSYQMTALTTNPQDGRVALVYVDPVGPQITRIMLKVVDEGGVWSSPIFPWAPKTVGRVLREATIETPELRPILFASLEAWKSDVGETVSGSPHSPDIDSQTSFILRGHAAKFFSAEDLFDFFRNQRGIIVLEDTVKVELLDPKHDISTWEKLVREIAEYPKHFFGKLGEGRPVKKQKEKPPSGN